MRWRRRRRGRWSSRGPSWRRCGATACCSPQSVLTAQAGGSIPIPFLVILVFWLSAIFVGFTLFARTNLVVMTSLLVCALSFAGAIFLVLELDNPFTGLLGISSSTLRSTLLPLNS
jgi:hypothetical protein